MENKLDNATEILENLKRALTKLDFTLELYYDNDLSDFEKDIFIDCKLCQQEALGYANEMEKIIKTFA